VLQNFTNFPSLFADGAPTTSPKRSQDLGEWDKFTAIIDKGKTTLVAMRTAAVAGDTAKYTDSLKASAASAASATCSTAKRKTEPMRSLVALVLAFTLLSGAVLAASMTNDQLVAARVAAMKQDGMVLRGAKSLSGQAAIDAATIVIKNFTKFPSLFPPGSITAKSRATEKIWQNWA